MPQSIATRLLIIPALIALSGWAEVRGATNSLRWWRGNLHTHSYWSDGDDYPEMVADWYKTNGYHFLAISDHNSLQDGRAWVIPAYKENGRLAHDKYVARFGTNWVVSEIDNQILAVRLKTFAEYRSKLEEPGRFLMIPADEVSQTHGPIPVHLVAVNVRQLVANQTGGSVHEVLQRVVNEVLRQRQATGEPMFPHVAHPNYGWAVTAEDMIALRGERFFEIYNGHMGVPNDGDEDHIGMQRMWDIILAHRVAAQLEPLWGLAVDDSHHYHRQSAKDCNSGRGWVQVRAPELTARAIIGALEAGDFYASSGVTLRDVTWATNRLTLAMEPLPGVRYTTRFIGTRRGFDPASQPVPGRTEGTRRTSRVYSADIGVVLAEVEGDTAEYVCRGDELYVRAVVTSTRRMPNPVKANERESAWVQPVFPRPASP